MARIALGQVNLTVGDLAGNVERMASTADRATQAGADVVAFPELAITGYPPEDLVHRGEFVRENLEALDALARKTATACPVITGFIDRTDAGLHNAAALLRNGTVESRYHKMQLPNFGVFDERRYFVPGETGVRVEVGGVSTGLSVCEDAWHDAQPFAGYAGLPLIVNINGSPYHRGKIAERAEILAARARQTGAWIAYVNAVGGQDELVFDGGSMMVAPDGTVRQRATTFSEDLLLVDLHGDTSFADARPEWPTDDADEVWQALVLGARRLRAQERLHAGGARAVGGHRLGDHRRARGRRARSRRRARARDALAIQLARERGRRRRLRRAPRHAHRHDRRSPVCSTPTGTRSPSSSRARRRTSPRRTCRRASAATC